MRNDADLTVKACVGAGFAVLCVYLMGLVVQPGVSASAHLSEIPVEHHSHLQNALSLDDARHFLSRTGFGAHPFEIQQLIGLTRAEAIDRMMQGIGNELVNQMPDWVLASAPRYALRKEMSRTQRRSFNRARDREMNELREWWVREMLETPTPQTERLVLFWHNHFVSTYAALGEKSTSMGRQNALFRKNAISNYRLFLKKIIRDPAMLEFLDNSSNRKKSPNENFARELLELFTLGEGHYSEQDVKTAARALTGNTVDPLLNMQYRFNKKQHDYSLGTLFGTRGRFDGDDLIDMILQQPRAATYLTEKFWKYYVGTLDQNIPAREKIAATFRNSNYELSVLFRSILESEAFWSADTRAGLIKSPVDLVIGTIRTTGQMPRNWQSLASVMARQGQKLFDAPNVAGWTGGSAWITPERLLARLEWLGDFEQSLCHDLSCSSPDKTIAVSIMGDEAMAVGELTSLNEENSVTIRLAAEAFLGVPEYQIALLKKGQTIWQSTVFAASSAHDTEQYGRLKGMQNLPWVTEQLAVSFANGAREEFDAISVEFLNDHAGSAGDRNLYVDWISLAGETYFTSDGIQKSSCPPRQRDLAGNLYCAGTVTIEKGSAILPRLETMGAPTLTRQPLSVGFAAIAWVDNPQRTRAAWSEIGFELHHVRFANRVIYSLRLRLAKGSDGQLSLWMASDGCWSDCLEVWPDCAGVDEQLPLFRKAGFALDTGEPAARAFGAAQSSLCRLDDLDQADRALVEGLWQVLPEIYQSLKSSPRLQKARFGRFYDSWSTYFKQVEKSYASYSSNNPTNKPVELVLDNPSLLEAESRAAVYPASIPLPLQRSVNQYIEDVHALSRKLRRNITPAQILMAAIPEFLMPKKSDISALLVAPTYQLK